MRVCWLTPGLIFALGCASLPLPERIPSEVVSQSTEDDDDPLTLAADCLARGDETAAATHFEVYVRKNPDQLMFRAHLAGLYFKLHRPNEAKLHYEQFVADAQDATGPPNAHLVHCHTRLMEIAQLTDDRFGELFHRGVGLLLLTRQESEDEETREEILCKAIKALRDAAEVRPTDARVHVYLAEAYDRAGNRRAAEVSRSSARNLAAPSILTPFEGRSLE